MTTMGYFFFIFFTNKTIVYFNSASNVDIDRENFPIIEYMTTFIDLYFFGVDLDVFHNRSIEILDKNAIGFF